MAMLLLCSMEVQTRLQQDFAKDFMRRSFFENFYVTHCFDYLIGAPFPKQILAKSQVYLL